MTLLWENPSMSNNISMIARTGEYEAGGGKKTGPNLTVTKFPCRMC